MIEVEVVYALPQRQQLRRLTLDDGATVADALAKAGLEELTNGNVGIFGRVVDRQQRLKDGDRIEVYRPLLADPKLARRRRAAAARRR
ncbi:MAG: hypothetical protein JWR16_3281 [Nevskia sp.]|nr:hypothetical protein [Nevskia sp.]